MKTREQLLFMALGGLLVLAGMTVGQFFLVLCRLRLLRLSCEFPPILLR